MTRPFLKFRHVLFFMLAAATAGAWIARAGSLEPSAAPAPTMKTLDNLSSAWIDLITPVQRFEPVMSGEAVLDHETGLVWVQTPVSTLLQTWVSGVSACAGALTGGRGGWRLPAVEEVMTLAERTDTGFTLPAGHPFDFSDLGQLVFWTMTDAPVFTNSAYMVNFDDPGYLTVDSKTGGSAYCLCVRGGNGPALKPTS